MAADVVLSHRSYGAAWSWYIRGHVVSLHAKRLIIQFIAACCGKSTTTDHNGDDADETLAALVREAEAYKAAADAKAKAAADDLALRMKLGLRK